MHFSKTPGASFSDSCPLFHQKIPSYGKLFENFLNLLKPTLSFFVAPANTDFSPKVLVEIDSLSSQSENVFLPQQEHMQDPTYILCPQASIPYSTGNYISIFFTLGAHALISNPLTPGCLEYVNLGSITNFGAHTTQ